MLGVVFLFLIAVNVAFVPAAHWWKTFVGFFRFSGLPTPSTGASSAPSPPPPAPAASATSR